MNKNFLRGFYGVVAGYLIFALSAVLLFKISNIDPHGKVPLSLMIFTTIYGSIFSMASGFIAGLIAGRKELLHAGIVACLLLAIAVISLVTAQGEHWSQWVSIFIFVPFTYLGGYIRKRIQLSK